MRKVLFPALALAMVVAGCGEVPSAPLDSGLITEGAPQAAFATVAPDFSGSGAPLVLVFDRDNPPADVEALVSSAGGQLMFSFPEVGLAVASADNASFAEIVGTDPAVESVGTTGQWRLPATEAFVPEWGAPTGADWAYYAYQWNIRRVGADQAWAAGATGSHNTVVAIIDTGIDATHPDLSPNVVYQACMQLAGPCADDALTGTHGTHVAGIVAAAFDGGAAVGVGPNLGLAGYQVFENNGEAYDFSIWWAILDAAQQGFEVINMSLGGYGIFGQSGGMGAAAWRAWNRVVDYAVRAGITVVASAGNEGVNVNGTLYHIPGDLPGIINVAATGIQPDPFFPQAGAFDIPAFYTNSGAAVTLSAPGGDCGEVDQCSGTPPSGYPYNLYLVLSTVPNGYAWTGGTSQAAPHVAGAAGLVMDQNPELTPRQVAAILRRTADRIGRNQLFSRGMLDVLGAVRVASR